MSLVLKIAYISYGKTCPTTAPWCLDGRDSSVRHFHDRSAMAGSHREGEYPQFGPYVLCWLDLGWGVHADVTVQTPGDTVSQADGMELIAVNTSG